MATIVLMLLLLTTLPGCLYMTAANLGISALSTLSSGSPTVPPPSPEEQTEVVNAYHQCLERSKHDPYVNCAEEMANVLQSTASSGSSGYRLDDTPESLKPDATD